MLKKLEINNIQCHKKTSIKFSKGVNYIIGKSDTGKTSAWQRVPRWLFIGQMFSDWIRHGKKDCGAKATFYDGTTIERSKKSGKNEVVLNGEPFNAIGRGKLPEEITRAINLNANNFNSNGRLLLDMRPGDRAKHLNKLINIDKIDIASKNANREITKLSAELKAKQEKLKIKSSNLKELSWIDEVEGKLEEFSGIESKLSSIVNKREEINEILEDRRGIEKELKALDKDYPPIDKIDAIIDLYKELEKIENRVEEIDDILSERKAIAKEIKKLRAESDKIKTDILEQFPDVCPLCNQEIEDKSNLL